MLFQILSSTQDEVNGVALICLMRFKRAAALARAFQI